MAGIDHNINTLWNGQPGQPENFPDPSPNPVSLNGPADLPGSCEADTAVIESIGK